MPAKKETHHWQDLKNDCPSGVKRVKLNDNLIILFGSLRLAVFFHLILTPPRIYRISEEEPRRAQVVSASSGHSNDIPPPFNARI